MRAIVQEDMQTFDARTQATVPSIDRKKIKKVQMIHNWTEEIVLDRSRKPFIAHIYIQQWRKANCNDNKIALSCVVHQLRFCTYRSLWRILLYGNRRWNEQQKNLHTGHSSSFVVSYEKCVCEGFMLFVNWKIIHYVVSSQTCSA